MLTNEEIKLFDGWLVSIALTGSKSLSWIENHHDTDYVFYVNDMKNHKALVELFKLKPKNECWRVSCFDIKARIYAYQYHFLQVLYGNEVPQYDIFEHSNDYKRKMVEYGLNKPLTPYDKFWYHILTGIYMLQNGKYELTDEQIANVRLCHDKQMTQEIYDYIQGMLLEYKVQLGL